MLERLKVVKAADWIQQLAVDFPFPETSTFMRVIWMVVAESGPYIVTTLQLISPLHS